MLCFRVTVSGDIFSLLSSRPASTITLFTILLFNLVLQVFGREPSTTLNADEAVSRGCALQCAMLSPTFKVKDFSLTDLQPYPIMVRIMPQVNANKPNEYDVFPRFHQAPFSRVLSIYRREPFTVSARAL